MPIVIRYVARYLPYEEAAMKPTNDIERGLMVKLGI